MKKTIRILASIEMEASIEDGPEAESNMLDDAKCMMRLLEESHGIVRGCGGYSIYAVPETAKARKLPSKRGYV